MSVILFSQDGEVLLLYFQNLSSLNADDRNIEIFRLVNEKTANEDPEPEAARVQV